VTGRRNACVARLVTMRRAHADSALVSVGLQTKILRRLGESAAFAELNGPSMRIVPTCGKNE
jgi:hypothetical protein